MEQVWNDLQTNELITGQISRVNSIENSDDSAEVRVIEMRPLAKLLHKTYASYLPTAFPAHYYGMPNGQIYLVFSRFYEIKFGGSGLEFVFAMHKEFSYDYENDKIIPTKNIKTHLPVFAESLDKPDEEISILKIRRGLNSYGEAFNVLNQEARNMLVCA